MNLAPVAVDLDRVGALIGGPGEKDLAQAEGRLQVESRGVFERLVMEAPRLKPRRDATGNPSPPDDAIERMPAVIEQDAAARELRIDAPVGDAGRANGCRRLSSAMSASASIGQRRRRPRRPAPRSCGRSAL